MHLGIDMGWLILCLFLTHFRSRDLAGTKMFALFTNLNLFINVHVFKPFKVCKLCIFLKTKVCKYWSIRLQYKSVTIKMEKAVYYWFVNINAPSTDYMHCISKGLSNWYFKVVLLKIKQWLFKSCIKTPVSSIYNFYPTFILP